MSPEGPGGRPHPVFFLSDYGLADEFVGIVHAVLARRAPAVPVVDLAHQLPPFDVAAGSETLRRCAPHLGPGVVLAVVDPGVGSARRPLVLEAGGPGAPLLGRTGQRAPRGRGRGGRGARRGVGPRRTRRRGHGRHLRRPGRLRPGGGRPGHRSAPGDLGRPVAVDSVVRLAAPLVELTGTAGAWTLVVEVTWVDRFGNVQLAAGPDDLAGVRPDPAAGLEVAVGVPPGPTRPVRPVRAFAELAPGQLGLLTDATGRLALVEAEAPADRRLGVGPGSVVRLGPAPPV